MESWDAYSVDRIPTGKSVVRGQEHPEGLYHMVVHIAIFNSDGKLLIQRRCLEKPTFPGKWDVTVGGSALCGETSREAMHRELLEELGIAADRDKMLLLTRIKRRNSLLDVWLTESNAPAEKLTLQQTEVAEAKWITGKELKEMIKNGSFHNYGKEYFESVFEKIEDYRGAVV